MLNEEIVIETKGLSKGYYPLRKGGYKFHALSDVSFKLSASQRVGIIGTNGSGKSTLLKILSGLIKPSSGKANVIGKVNALIELGSNFIPDLTGRENVSFFLRINDVPNDEIPDIIEKIKLFSGLEDYFDQPIKHYSSGMYVRLAISAGFHINAEIFLIDEVLQAGDAAFRERVTDHFKSISNNGATIVLASHSPEEISANCTDCIWLEKGRLKMYGPTDEVLESYYKSLTKAYSESKYLTQSLSNNSVVSGLGDIDKAKLKNDLLEVIDFNISPKTGETEITYDNGFNINIKVKKLSESHSIYPSVVIYDIYMKPIAMVMISNDDILYQKINETQSHQCTLDMTCTMPGKIISFGEFYAELCFGKDTKVGELYNEEAFKLPNKIAFKVSQGKHFDFTGGTRGLYIKPDTHWILSMED